MDCRPNKQKGFELVYVVLKCEPKESAMGRMNGNMKIRVFQIYHYKPISLLEEGIDSLEGGHAKWVGDDELV